jgi:hypothetical protein
MRQALLNPPSGCYFYLGVVTPRISVLPNVHHSLILAMNMMWHVILQRISLDEVKPLNDIPLQMPSRKTPADSVASPSRAFGRDGGVFVQLPIVMMSTALMKVYHATRICDAMMCRHSKLYVVAAATHHCRYSSMAYNCSTTVSTVTKMRQLLMRMGCVVLALSLWVSTIWLVDSEIRRHAHHERTQITTYAEILNAAVEAMAAMPPKSWMRM